MKIAIYGTSRSGKDYQISHMISCLKKNRVTAIHVPGSTTLNELSDRIYNCKFKLLSQDKQCFLREEFIKVINQFDADYEVVFVDGHFAFPKNDDFEIVFTEADRNCYDHFFYLDAATELILENSRKSEGDKKNTEIQLDDIKAWKTFEIDGMQKVCASLNKELVIIDEDIQTCAEFVLSWVQNFNQKYDYQTITKNLVKEFLNEIKLEAPLSVLAIDCDNTLAMNDTTYDFCDCLGIDKQLLKQIFLGDRYSSYQFFKTNKLYSQFNHSDRNNASQNAMQKIKISPDLKQAIDSNKYSLVIALTAGLTEIWQSKLDELDGVNSLFGNTSNSESLTFVTPIFKKCFVDALRNNDCLVTAIGDSIIDIPMLESSDNGFIVAHNKINKAVLKYFEENSKSKISQLFTTDWLYPINQVSGIN